MKICIVGGSGFLGARLIRRLRDRPYQILSLDIKAPDEPCDFKFCDIARSDQLVKLQGFDCLINLAAEHRDDVRPESRYYEVNVNGAKNACKMAVDSGIKRLIFTSSVAVYGFAPPGTGESGAINFFNEYGKTKYLAEEVYKTWQKEDPGERCLVIIRPTVIFGEKNRGNVYNLMQQIASRRFLMFGNGKNRKSLAYVENVAAFLEFCLPLTPGVYIYNYVDKPDLEINELVILARRKLFRKNNVGIRLPMIIGLFLGYSADFFARIIGRSLPISGIRMRKFMTTTQFSSATDSTGFVAPVSLNEGLERTIEHEFS